MIREYFQKKFSGQRLIVLGFGREGRAACRALEKYLPDTPYLIADRNPSTVTEFQNEFGSRSHVSFSVGEAYLDPLLKGGLVLKSPGISLRQHQGLKKIPGLQITSQTAVFLDLFKKQVTGVTGTKGKSTTTCLLYEMFKLSGQQVLLGGNIGTPPFLMLEQVKEDSQVVFEMSSHQLENINVSPGYSVLLNIFQEHLDHYHSYRDYQRAKLNIALWQKPEDVFLYTHTQDVLRDLLTGYSFAGQTWAIQGISAQGKGALCKQDDLLIVNGEQTTRLAGVFKDRQLPGVHNLTNIIAAALVAHLKGVAPDVISAAVAGFAGLPHRLQWVGSPNGVLCYNDSISTIPESTIEALKTLPAVQTLLLGGFDRGIDYTPLVDYLLKHPVDHLVFLGKAGKRMQEQLLEANPLPETSCMWFDDFRSAVMKALSLTRPGRICLLSPAAASYDMFDNFEQRGEKFRQLILSFGNPTA